MAKRNRFTKAEQRIIRRMTREGKSQSMIAKRLGASKDGVRIVQRKAGLPTRRPTPEREILALYGLGLNMREIHVALKCPMNRILDVIQSRGLSRPVGFQSNAIEEPTVFLPLVDRALRIFGGTFPCPDDLFAAALMKTLKETSLKGQSEDVLEFYRAGIRDACATLRMVEGGVIH